MRILLATAFALFAGLMMTRVFKYLRLNFPDVTAFLIAGVLVGPFCLGATSVPGLGFDSMEDLSRVTVLSNVALGFIAFDIGNEFRLAQLKHTGKTATVIGILQAVIASLLVDAALIGLHFIVGPDVLPLHRVQWETGVGFSRTFDSEAFTLNNTLLRYGLTNFAELRLGFDILNLRQRHTEDSKYGVSALTIGSKIKMLEGAGLMPSVSALIEMACPHIGSRDFVPDHLAPSLYLLVNHDVADWLGIGYSAGAEWGGSDPAPAAFWALTLSNLPRSVSSAELTVPPLS